MKPLHIAESSIEYGDFKDRYRLHNGWRFWCMIAFLSVLMAYFAIDLLVTQTYFPLYVLIFGAVLTVVYFTVHFMRLKSAYRKSPLSSVPLVVTRFYEDRLEQESTEDVLSAEYALLYGVIETRSNYFFMVTKKQAMVVAKRDCSTELISHIAMLRNKCRAEGKTDGKWRLSSIMAVAVGAFLAVGVAMMLEIVDARVNRDPMKCMIRKPVIYLYPEERTEITVTLDIDGELTCTYPEYNGGWEITALPDGTLYDESGREYDSLFWEAQAYMEFDFSEGFCVKGEDTVEFLQWALDEQGLTQQESNDFILYWLPYMQDNEYNVISFQGDSYTDIAGLSITPQHDNIKRVFMAYYPSEKYVDIAEQRLYSFERNGFTVVEWGGTVTE